MSNSPQFTWALVTGASSGIGKALSILLANKGINLIIHGRQVDQLAEIAAELIPRVQVHVVSGDLSIEKDRQKLIDVIDERSPDLVINNAGFGLYGEALTLPVEEQLKILDVNARAVFLLSLEAARTLIEAGKKGVILNVSSVAADFVFPSFAVYSATKAFVNSFSEAFDFETSPHGVRVLTACPGMVDTHFRERAGGSDEKKQFNPMTATYAAEQIWMQIQKGKRLHSFNWIYRLSLFINTLLPKQWMARILKKSIEARHPPQPIIKKGS